MTIIFLRHGDAEEASPQGRDETRKLTAKGRRETTTIAAALDRLHLRPKYIFTSPLRRAVQTAEIAAREFRDCPKPAQIEPLAPGHNWKDVQRAVLAPLDPRLRAEAVILLCGHQPDMGQYLAQALTGIRGNLELRKSAAICVEWPEDDLATKGRIALALTPKLARRFGPIDRRT